MNNIGLIQAFTNPLEYLSHGADASGQIILGSVNQIGNEIDEFVTGALRNNLLGLPLDLAALNIARGRDVGVAGLNVVRNQLYKRRPRPPTTPPIMTATEALRELGRVRPIPQAPGLAGQFRGRLRHASLDFGCHYADRQAYGGA